MLYNSRYTLQTINIKARIVSASTKSVNNEYLHKEPKLANWFWFFFVSVQMGIVCYKTVVLVVCNGYYGVKWAVT